jgi:hypothetical protein
MVLAAESHHSFCWHYWICLRMGQEKRGWGCGGWEFEFRSFSCFLSQR